jgi:hypothetical protein
MKIVEIFYLENWGNILPEYFSCLAERVDPYAVWVAQKLQLRSYFLCVLCPAGDLELTIQEGTQLLNLRDKKSC